MGSGAAPGGWFAGCCDQVSIRMSGEMAAEFPTLRRVSAASPPLCQEVGSPSPQTLGRRGGEKGGKSISVASELTCNLPPPVCILRSKMRISLPRSPPDLRRISAVRTKTPQTLRPKLSNCSTVTQRSFGPIHDCPTMLYPSYLVSKAQRWRPMRLFETHHVA